VATYSFKSSGKTPQQQALETLNTSKIPFGIKTPMTLAGAGEGLLAMNYNIADQFADNLRNLLLTNWGERLGHYQFGANLRPLTTEFASQENFDNQAIERIRNAVNEWMPFVTLGTFESSVDRTENKNTAVILIKITYSIPAIEVIDRALQIVLYVI
jgi:phage baseplate assembly protein W